MFGYARAELTTVRNGLLMFQAESGVAAFPSAAAINSYSALRDILYQYVRLPDEDLASFTFHSYARARADTFVLKARAKDRKRTIITVTPASITP